MKKEEKILLGQKVRDKVTGFTGIVDHIGEYMFQCRSIGIRGALTKTGTLLDIEMIDEPQLEIVTKKPIMEVEVPEPLYAFGQEVVDTITGYKGTIVARAVYLNGCARVALQPKHDPKKEKITTGTWFSEEQVKPIGKKLPLTKEKEAKTGGPALTFNDSRNLNAR